jgi:hypothetical protein
VRRRINLQRYYQPTTAPSPARPSLAFVDMAAEPPPPLPPEPGRSHDEEAEQQCMGGISKSLHFHYSFICQLRFNGIAIVHTSP